jgi:hypothetical protein
MRNAKIRVRADEKRVALTYRSEKRPTRLAGRVAIGDSARTLGDRARDCAGSPSGKKRLLANAALHREIQSPGRGAGLAIEKQDVETDDLR